ncbi:MAG: S8 family serine peptidase [Bdellovibrionota bacterium]
MTRPQLCIYSYVERILCRANFIVLFLALTASTAFAQNNKFIVRFKPQNNLHPFLRAFAKQQNLTNLADKVNNETNVKATALENVNVMIAEGTKEEVEAAVADNNTVAYIEEDKEIKIAESDNYGAKPANSPYLNTLGLTASNPAYTDTATGTPLLVAVIDTGIDLDHPYLMPFLSTNSGETPNDGIDNDGNGFIDDYYGASTAQGILNGDVQDVYDHGSHVAGLIKIVRDQAIAMGYNEAKNIQVLPIRFFYNCGSGLCGTTSGAIQALNYAMSRGAQVVNMSWGSEGAESYSQALYETLVDLYNHDIVLVAAAGNESSNIDSTPFFPAALNSAIPGLISVNSITTYHYSNGSLDEIALSYFSNYGTQGVDVAAVGSTWFLFGGMLSANAYHVAGSSSNKFVPKSGTSMASPIVAGIAAVVRAVNEDLNAFDVKELILQNAVVPMNGSTKILGNKNRAEGYAHAINSFQAADGASGSGLLPAATNASYSTYSSNSDSGAAAGCGSIMNPGPGGGNPFGGNSMGLFTALFFLVQFARKMRYKLIRC